MIDYTWDKVREALHHLNTNMDEEEVWYVSDSTLANCLPVIDALQSLGIPPAKIIPHGGDSVTFLWNNTKHRFMFSVVEDEEGKPNNKGLPIGVRVK